MPRPVVLTKSLAAASANNIALSQAGTAGVPLLLNGATAGVLDSQRRVLITSGGDDSGITFTILGTNDSGQPVKSIVAGSNGGTVATPQDLRRIASVVPSGATASTVTVGTNTIGSSPWVRFDPYIPTPNLALSGLVVSGAANWTAEYTYDEFLPPVPLGSSVSSAVRDGPASPNPTALAVTALTAESGAADTGLGSLKYPMTGWRLTINSGTGTVQLTGIQSGISGP